MIGKRRLKMRNEHLMMMGKLNCRLELVFNKKWTKARKGWFLKVFYTWLAGMQILNHLAIWIFWRPCFRKKLYCCIINRTNYEVFTQKCFDLLGYRYLLLSILCYSYCTDIYYLVSKIQTRGITKMGMIWMKGTSTTALTAGHYVNSKMLLD